MLSSQRAWILPVHRLVWWTDSGKVQWWVCQSPFLPMEDADWFRIWSEAQRKWSGEVQGLFFTRLPIRAVHSEVAHSGNVVKSWVSECALVWRGAFTQFFVMWKTSTAVQLQKHPWILFTKLFVHPVLLNPLLLNCGLYWSMGSCDDTTAAYDQFWEPIKWASHLQPQWNVLWTATVVMEREQGEGPTSRDGWGFLWMVVCTRCSAERRQFSLFNQRRSSGRRLLLCGSRAESLQRCILGATEGLAFSWLPPWCSQFCFLYWSGWICPH